MLQDRILRLNCRFSLALERDKFGRFAEVEPARNPFRLLALGTLAVQQIGGAIKLQQHAPERLKFLCHFRTQCKRLRRNPPVESGKKSARRNLPADKSGKVRGGFCVSRKGFHASDSKPPLAQRQKRTDEDGGSGRISVFVVGICRP